MVKRLPYTPLSGQLSASEFKKLVHAGKICFAGNRRLKIYGTLRCSSGKRMKKINRAFFSSEAEALASGYRPCCHCLREEYIRWKHRF